jgi:hypothetical protein
MDPGYHPMIAAVYASKSTDHLLADLARLSG